MRALWRFLRDKRGSSTVMVALAPMAMMGLGALAVDLGYVFSARSEVQKAADDAALAAALRLVQLYNEQGSSLTLTEVTSVTTEAAGTWAQQNTSTGNPDVPLTVADGDVVVGVWDPVNKTFTTGVTVDQINAVKVIVRRDQATNGPIQLMFGPVVGVSTVNVTAEAIAYVGDAGSVPEGVVTLPLLVHQDAYVAGTDLLQFHADAEDNSGWSTFFEPGGGNALVTDYIDGTLPIPAVKVGDLLRVYNGNMSNNIFNHMQQQVNQNGGEWPVVLPIVDGDPKFIQDMRVVGFATFVVTAASGAPSKTISGYFTTTTIPGGSPAAAISAPRPGTWSWTSENRRAMFDAHSAGPIKGPGDHLKRRTSGVLQRQEQMTPSPLGRGCRGKRPVFSVESPPQESRPTSTASSILLTPNISMCSLVLETKTILIPTWQACCTLKVRF